MDFTRLKKADSLSKRIKQHIPPAELEGLAKQGLCPHYRFIKPGTGEETYLFKHQEIIDWINKDLLKCYPSRFEPTINIFEYNRSLPEKHIPPAELVNVKNLLHLPLFSCAAPPGVYFLVKDNRVVYIGQSNNVHRRVAQHVTEGLKQFDTAFFIVVPEDHLAKVEKAFINTMRPVYNISVYPTKEHHTELVDTFKINNELN